METRIVSMSALQNIYSKLRIPVGLYRKNFYAFFLIVYNDKYAIAAS